MQQITNNNVEKDWLLQVELSRLMIRPVLRASSLDSAVLLLKHRPVLYQSELSSLVNL